MKKRTTGRQRRNRRERQRGAALVEGALTFTTFLMLLFGTMDFGRPIWALNMLSSAVWEGPRYAIVRGSTSGRAATQNSIASVVQASALACRPRRSPQRDLDPGNAPGNAVTVRAQYTFTPIIPLMTYSISLQSTSKMTILQ
jgi:Flp pilus assembly protein TadG